MELLRDEASLEVIAMRYLLHVLSLAPAEPASSLEVCRGVVHVGQNGRSRYVVWL